MKATSTELKRLVLRGRNTSYDSQISTYKVEVFAFPNSGKDIKRTEIVLMRKVLYHLGLANEQGYLTNAGAFDCR